MVLYFAMKMPMSDNKFRYDKFCFFYIPWLIKEVAVSAVKTSGCILGLRKFKSSSKKISTRQKSIVGTVIYANSITLTPGTLTLEIDGNLIYVHALCDSSFKELEIGEMDKKILELEM